MKRKVKDDPLHFKHYLDALSNLQTFVCKQNLISSTSHTVRTVHNRKVGPTAFDTKRWMCEDTVHTHSHGHRDTVPYLAKCIVNAGVLSRNDLPGTSPLLQC